MDSQESRFRISLSKLKIRTVSDWLTAIAGLLSGIVGAFFIINNGQTFRHTDNAVASSMVRENQDLLEAYQLRLEKLQQQIGSLAATPKSDPSYLQIQSLKNSVSSLDERLSRLENAISVNPAKALEVPMLRKDLDAMKDTQIVANTSLKESVDRVYDFNKWLLGGMAISVITLALSTFLKSKSSE